MAVTVLFIPVTGFVVLLRFGLYKKYAAELHEEGNIVDIEYYMRLVHNYDEKKKTLAILEAMLLLSCVVLLG